jgi:octaprenyl-diphosphate synthase
MNPLEKYKHLFQAELKLVDEKILSISQGKAALIGNLVSHMISSGGKRLRLIFVILSSKLCENKSDNHIKMAACVELLHTATLFHDDVVDKSKLRRGRKTANELWGNSASVLVGDFLLAQAFMIMAEVGNLEIIDVLSKTSSIITEGEVKQLMHKSDVTTSFEDYIDIIRGKTAELFSACCRSGAIISASEKIKKDALENFGRNLGIAFQITDDALDYIAQNQSLGKKNGDDFREGKATLPIIYAYINADKSEQEYLKKIFQENEEARDELEFAKVKTILNKYNSIEQTLKTADKYTKLAKENISIFGDSSEKEAILQILDFCVNRNF